MHILDVISSVSRPSQCNEIVGGWGFAPDPIGKVDGAPPNPLAGFKRPTLRPVLLSEVEGRGGKGEGAKMIYAPGVRNLRAATVRPTYGRGPRTLACGGPQFGVTPLQYIIKNTYVTTVVHFD